MNYSVVSDDAGGATATRGDVGAFRWGIRKDFYLGYYSLQL